MSVIPRMFTSDNPSPSMGLWELMHTEITAEPLRGDILIKETFSASWVSGWLELLTPPMRFLL